MTEAGDTTLTATRPACTAASSRDAMQVESSHHRHCSRAVFTTTTYLIIHILCCLPLRTIHLLCPKIISAIIPPNFLAIPTWTLPTFSSSSSSSSPITILPHAIHSSIPPTPNLPITTTNPLWWTPLLSIKSTISNNSCRRRPTAQWWLLPRKWCCLHNKMSTSNSSKCITRIPSLKWAIPWDSSLKQPSSSRCPSTHKTPSHNSHSIPPPLPTIKWPIPIPLQLVNLIFCPLCSNSRNPIFLSSLVLQMICGTEFPIWTNSATSLEDFSGIGAALEG